MRIDKREDDLDRFIADFRGLERDSEASPFNVLQAFGLSSRERPHSSFLAFLIDPENPHGLKDKVLGGVIKAATGRRIAFNPDTLRIRTEYPIPEGAVDICIEDDKVFCFMEVKVRSQEARGQTEKYAKRCKIESGQREPIMIFLTGLPSDSPSSADFRHLAWSQVVEVVKPLLRRISDPYIRSVTQDFVRNVEVKVVSEIEDFSKYTRFVLNHGRTWRKIRQSFEKDFRLFQQRLVSRLRDQFPQEKGWTVKPKGLTLIKIWRNSWFSRDKRQFGIRLKVGGKDLEKHGRFSIHLYISPNEKEKRGSLQEAFRHACLQLDDEGRRIMKRYRTHGGREERLLSLEERITGSVDETEEFIIAAARELASFSPVLSAISESLE